METHSSITDPEREGKLHFFFRKTMKEFLLVDLRLSFLRERTRERERNETRPEFKILSFSRRNNASGTKQEVESGKPSIKFLSRVHIFAAHKRVILFVLRRVYLFRSCLRMKLSLFSVPRCASTCDTFFSFPLHEIHDHIRE